MKMRDNEVVIERGGDMVESMFGISSKDSAHILTILRDKLYSNKILAVIREYCTNAQDAHAEIGNTEPIVVKCPTQLNYNFIVRDYGPGLSEDDIRNIYVMYGASTKRHSNDVVGQLGLGCKSAFAYVDKFQITSWYGGEKKVYCAYIDESGMGKMALLGTEETTEREGIEVKIPVKRHDIYKFSDEAVSILSFFDPKPEVSLYNRELIEFDYELTENLGANTKVSVLRDNYFHGISKVIMGGVPYPISPNLLGVDSSGNGFDNLLDVGIHLFVNIGDLDVSAHRESLEYTEHTKNSLSKYLNSATHLIVQKRAKLISDAETYREANISFKELKKRHRFWKEVRGIEKWKDRKLDGFAFRSTKIAEFWRPRYTNNGYRWFEQQDVVSDENLVIFEIDDPKIWKAKIGRWLTYKHIAASNVVVIRWKTDKGLDKEIEEYKKDRCFDDFKAMRVSDCKVPKEALPKTTRQTGVRSTAHIGKIFELNDIISHYGAKSKNWTRIDKIPDGKKYYVEIDRFTVQHKDSCGIISDIEVGSFKWMLRFVDFEKNFTPNKIYGVKKKYVQKLDKDWVLLFDEVKEFIKNGSLLQTYVDKKEYESTLSTHNNHVTKFIPFKDKFNKTSVAYKLLDSAENIHSIKKDGFLQYKTYEIERIINVFDLTKEAKDIKPTHDLKKLIDLNNKKYKLISELGVFPGFGSWSGIVYNTNINTVAENVAEYVNLIENIDTGD